LLKENRMRTRWWPCVALLCSLALAPAGTSRAADPKPGSEPGVVVRIKSLDGLLEDASYLAKAVGKEEEAKQFEKMITAQAGEKGLKGLDRTRPLGLYGTVGQFGFDSTAVALIPIKDEDAVLGLLENLNLKAEKGDDGVYKVQPDMSPVPIYFRFANRYAYVTAQNKDALDKANLKAPGDILPATEKALLSLTFRIDRVPEGMREQGLKEFQKKVDEEKDKREPSETDAQHQFKKEIVGQTSDFVTSLVNEGRAIQARIEVDRQKNELVVEASLDAQPGSKLAGMLEHLGQRESLFAGLRAGQPAFTLLTHCSVPAQVLKPLGDALDEAVKEGLAKEKDKAKREQGEKVAKALLPTLKSGDLDLGAVIRGPSDAKTYALVGGLKVKEGESLEKTVRQLVESQPEDKRKIVHFDAAKVGEVSVHRVDVSGILDADGKKAFGADAQAYFAFRPDAVVFAMGHDALGAMKEAVAAAPRAAPSFLLDLAMARLAPLMEKEHPEAIKSAAEAFKEKGTDRIHVVAQGGKALQVSLRLSPEVLNFMHLLDEAKKGKEKP
jgi:hypothetical protein